MNTGYHPLAMAAEIALTGTFQGRAGKLFDILGRRDAWADTTNFHDTCEYLGSTASFTELAGTESFEMVSSSANDTAAGTGTRTVDLCYIDSSYALVCTTITLNGTTPVAIGVLGARMIIGMEAASGGSSPVSAGNIILRLTGAGATHEQITAGGNKSLSARFMVPDGYEAIIYNWDKHAIRQAQDVRLRGMAKMFDRSLAARYLFQDISFLAADQNSSDEGVWRFPARAKIKMSSIAGSLAGTPRLDTSFSLILIAGD